MDVLTALADANGRPLTKEQLLEAAWPGIFVEETNVKVTISALRSVLRRHCPDSEFIRTIHGRGYWLAINRTTTGGITPPPQAPDSETAPFDTMGSRRLDTCRTLERRDDWTNLVIEHRTNGAGSHPARSYPCNELIIMLSGQSIVRRTGAGIVEQSLARAGTAWTGPVGFHEKCEIEKPLDCLHICLPPTLLENTALADYDVDPAKVELSFAGGFVDPTINHLSQAFLHLLASPPQPTDQLFADGLTTALTARLIAVYTIDRWKRPATTPTFDTLRLKRVLEYIEEHYAEAIDLDRLATEAGLSPSHFLRLFRQTIGSTPHRYVTDRRIRAAREALERGKASITEIAWESGFASEGNFTRNFRESTGVTPDRYRDRDKS
ncbi:helix-turn-helix domain-containing protein [Novosphingobium kaempferiae]|uniref:helix-turn-helix domain-containing protein n=1 Tax=Novosphingobium kaempferiae TaxID=2896849 RepID=UPI001E57A7DA|nr:helix-turn-helix domain-containing protein [Novosphingobium kaempferiae]